MQPHDMTAQIQVRWSRCVLFQQIVDDSVWKVAGQDRGIGYPSPLLEGLGHSFLLEYDTDILYPDDKIVNSGYRLNVPEGRICTTGWLVFGR
jgi:hypothetical protein